VVALFCWIAYTNITGGCVSIGGGLSLCWLTVFLVIPDVHGPVFIHDLPVHRMLTYLSILPLAQMRLVRTTCKYCKTRMKWLLVATVGGSALGFPRSIPPQVPIQKCIDKRTTRRSARLQCSSASMVGGGDGRIRLVCRRTACHACL